MATRSFALATSTAMAYQQWLNQRWRQDIRRYGKRFIPSPKDLYIAYPNGKACSTAGITFSSEKLSKVQHDDIQCHWFPGIGWKCWALPSPSGPMVFISYAISGTSPIDYWCSLWDIRKKQTYTGAKDNDGNPVTFPCRYLDFKDWYLDHVESVVYKNPWIDLPTNGGPAYILTGYGATTAAYYKTNPDYDWQIVAPPAPTYTLDTESSSPTGLGDATWHYNLTDNGQIYTFGGGIYFGTIHSSGSRAEIGQSPLTSPSDVYIYHPRGGGASARVFTCSENISNSVSDEESASYSGYYQLDAYSRSIEVHLTKTRQYISPFGALFSSNFSRTYTQNEVMIDTTWHLSEGTIVLNENWTSEYLGKSTTFAASPTLYLAAVMVLVREWSHTQERSIHIIDPNPPYGGDWVTDSEETVAGSPSLVVHASAFEVKNMETVSIFSQGRSTSLENAIRGVSNKFNPVVMPGLNLVQLKK